MKENELAKIEEEFKQLQLLTEGLFLFKKIVFFLFIQDIES